MDFGKPERATSNYLQKLNQHVAPGILPVSHATDSGPLQDMDALNFRMKKIFLH